MEKTILAEQGKAEFTEKKSKFIAYCKHVANEEEAQNFIHEIKKKHWDATHNVYAYQIGELHEIQRSSDDGEPAGTAGRPILEAIKGAGIHDAAVVVTRYFGGILLGTGGLVRAYGKVAQLSLEEAQKAKRIEASIVCSFMDYEVAGKVENFLIREGYTIDHIDYQNNVAIYCMINKTKTESFLLTLKENFPQGVHSHILDEEKWLELPLV